MAETDTASDDTGSLEISSENQTALQQATLDLIPDPTVVFFSGGMIGASNAAFKRDYPQLSSKDWLSKWPEADAFFQEVLAGGERETTLLLENQKVPLKGVPAGNHILIQLLVGGLAKEEDERDALPTCPVENMEAQAWMGVIDRMTGLSMCVMDPQMRICHVNREFSELSGYSAEELMGMSVTDLLMVRDVQLAKSFHENRMRCGPGAVPAIREYAAAHKEGHQVEVRVSSAVMPNHYSVVTVFDISHFRESERAIMMREQNYRTLFETTGACTVLCEEDMTITLANEQFCKMSGYSKEELEGRRRALEFIHPEDLALVVSNMSRRRSGESNVPRCYELRGVGKSGNIIHLWMTVSLVPGTKRSINSLIDITHLKETEDALKHRIELEEFLNRITSNFISATPENFDDQMQEVLAEIGKYFEGDRVQILEFQSDNTVLSCSQEWCAEGVAPSIQELGSFSVEPLQTWLDRAGDCKPYTAQVAELGDEEMAQASFLKGYGAQSVLVVPLLSADHPVGLVRVDAIEETVAWSDQDISVLATAASTISTAKTSVDAMLNQEIIEEQMRQNHKLESLGVLAGGIAHDFNNILTAIIGYCDLAMDDNDDIEDIQECLGEILGSAQRAKDLVSQILLFSRKSPVSKKPVSMRRVVEEAIGMVRAMVPSLISIDYEVRCATATVRADATQMHQILMNLCTNAFHAMKDGGTLTLRLQNRRLSETTPWGNMMMKEGDYLELVAMDSGSGIPRDILERVFDPFFTTKETGEGSGMGLATVHGIIADHGGGIICESKVGVGTTFRILLPLCLEAEATPEARRAGSLPMSMEQKSIMVVDDEKRIRNVQERLLNGMGFDVTVFKNGADALSVFEKYPHRFDLIITDWAMPEMNGADLAARIKQIREDVPVIICTGFSEMIFREEPDLAVFDVLAKPFMKEDLASLIERALRHA